MTPHSSPRVGVFVTAALLLFLEVLSLFTNHVSAMSIEEKRELRDQTMSMFRHAYDSYMKYAFPADELMPLSCRGRFRGSEPSRGNDDDALGNFTLTLVDTLDSLALMDLDEFEKATKVVVEHVKFDTDVVVSVFETNIRMLGGLLGGHAMAIDVKQRHSRMQWYADQLLRLAEDLGRRLLPAFNSTTGIPFSRINLRHGIDKNARETCTACAGTMILEFATLSRLSGDPIFETKARHAMEQLWNFRHRESDLVGTVINVESGEWQRRDSGIGAGIDSYYEYLFKGYILLSDDDYLDRFNAHYKSIRKYVQRGPLWVDVHMHKPTTTAKNFMDALAAYWPGLQVLKGDLTSAIETHEMLYQVMQRHGGFLPEAFTTDFRVHWGQSPLRPEFIESTYFLYKATGDEHYLDVGKAVLNSIEVLAKVPCGYAAIKDVRTGRHEDRMDSFVLAELFKYLFLLFSEESDLTVNVNDYLFTTEAHLLPLNIGSTRGAESISPPSTAPLIRREEGDETYDEDDEAVCPAHPRLKMRFPGMTEDIRKPLQNLVQQACPTVEQSAGSDTPQLRASDFQAGNKEHVATLEKMGIRLVTMKDGRVQLLQTTSQAASTEDARQGMMFMQDMIQLSKTAAVQEEPQTRLVRYLDDEAGSGSVGEGANVVDLIGGPAQFGYDLSTQRSVEAEIVIIKPFSGCGEITNAEEDVRGKIAVMQRGDCMFIVKARAVEEMGAVGGIVIDNNADSSASSSPIFAMSGDGSDDVGIPLVFLFDLEGRRILHAHWKRPRMKVVLTDGKNPSSPKKTTTTTSTVTTIEEEFKIVAASDKDEVIGDEKKTNDANESHDKYLDIYQVLDGESEIVHVGNDELKLVIRSIRDSGRESSGWLFHPSLRVVDAGGSRDKENPNRETDESKRKFYLYIDADVPFSTTSSSSASNPSTSLPPATSSTPNLPSDSAPPSTTLSNADGSPPWEQLRTSIVSVMESTTNIKSTDDDAAEVNDAIDALTFIASRALDRQRGKASRLRLSNEQMRQFGALSQRLRVLDESIVEREVIEDFKEAFASLGSSSSSPASPSYSIPRQSPSPSLITRATSKTTDTQTSPDTLELDSKSKAQSDFTTNSVLQQQTQHSPVVSSPDSGERWQNLKVRSREDSELADLLDEVENFLQDPELQRYVTASERLGLSQDESTINQGGSEEREDEDDESLGDDMGDENVEAQTIADEEAGEHASGMDADP